MKVMRKLRRPSVVLVVLVAAAIVVWTVERARGMGFYLSETKEQLKLNYDVAVHDLAASGRVTIVFTLADEGRLKPLDEVQFCIPAKEKNPDGSYSADLVVSIAMFKSDGGKRVGRVEILRDLAQRAEILLNTHTLDGKFDGMTRLHHPIRIADYMKARPDAPPAATTAAPPAEPAPPAATERKN